MKKVLCFGDSNTFGFIQESGKRYDKNTRWSGILAQLAPPSPTIPQDLSKPDTKFCRHF